MNTNNTYQQEKFGSIPNKQFGPPIVFSTRHVAKFSELDPNAHLSTPFYLNYIVDHRFTGIRDSLGLSLRDLSKLPVVFIIREIKIKFLKSIIADEVFNIESYISSLREMDCDVDCKIFGTRGVYAEAKIVVGCVSKETHKLCVWQDEIISKFFQGK